MPLSLFDGEQGVDRASIYAAQKALDIDDVSVSPQEMLSIRLHCAQAYLQRCYKLDLQAEYDVQYAVLAR